jgi:hypothetical protein
LTSTKGDSTASDAILQLSRGASLAVRPAFINASPVIMTRYSQIGLAFALVLAKGTDFCSCSPGPNAGGFMANETISALAQRVLDGDGVVICSYECAPGTDMDPDILMPAPGTAPRVALVALRPAGNVFAVTNARISDSSTVVLTRGNVKVLSVSRGASVSGWSSAMLSTGHATADVDPRSFVGAMTKLHLDGSTFVLPSNMSVHSPTDSVTFGGSLAALFGLPTGTGSTHELAIASIVAFESTFQTHRVVEPPRGSKLCPSCTHWVKSRPPESAPSAIFSAGSDNCNGAGTSLFTAFNASAVGTAPISNGFSVPSSNGFGTAPSSGFAAAPATGGFGAGTSSFGPAAGFGANPGVGPSRRRREQ